jgi:hypothetical protein
MTTIKIKLGGNSLAKWDFTNPIIVPEQVSLKFKSSIYNLENVSLMVTIRNRMQDKVKQFKVNEDLTVDITDMVEVGELEIEIASYVTGSAEATKIWRVPNITCKQVGYEFEIIPELQYMREEINDINKAIQELTKQLKENNALL